MLSIHLTFNITDTFEFFANFNFKLKCSELKPIINLLSLGYHITFFINVSGEDGRPILTKILNPRTKFGHKFDATVIPHYVKNYNRS